MSGRILGADGIVVRSEFFNRQTHEFDLANIVVVFVRIECQV
jgi:hypothetical protein